MKEMAGIIAALERTGKVRILSDLHLGHDLSTVRTVASLRPLIAGASTVVFNGDTYQERKSGFRIKAAAMLEELQALCREEGAEAIFLRGNHDPETFAWELLDLEEGRVTITHGDVWLRLISPWSREMPQLRPVLEKIHAASATGGVVDLEEKFEILRRCRLALPPSMTRQRDQSFRARANLFFREIWPPRRPWEVLKVYAQLPGLAGAFVEQYRPRCQVLVFGHTHRAKIWRRGGRLLVNTGAFVTFAAPLMVEIEEGMVKVLSLTGDSEGWRIREVIRRARLR